MVHASRDAVHGSRPRPGHPTRPSTFLEREEPPIPLLAKDPSSETHPPRQQVLVTKTTRVPCAGGRKEISLVVLFIVVSIETFGAIPLSRPPVRLPPPPLSGRLPVPRRPRPSPVLLRPPLTVPHPASRGRDPGHGSPNPRDPGPAPNKRGPVQKEPSVQIERKFREVIP